MDTSTRARGYDLFKLIVALLLLMLFLMMFGRPGSRPPSAATASAFIPTMTDANPSAVVETRTTPSHASTPAPSRLSTETVEPSSAIQLSPTATSRAVSTPTALSSPVGTTAVEATVTLPPSPTAAGGDVAPPTPSPTGTVIIEAGPTPVESGPSAHAACEAVIERSRLQTGRSATLLRRLNFRSSPGIQNNWLRTNLFGTQVEVVGGPECLPHLWGAYLWWQIRLPNGETGWSAESSIHGTFYFMEPE